MKTIFSSLALLLALAANAAEFQCYEFIRVGEPRVMPSIVTRRITINGTTHTFSQEIIPLNEVVDDALDDYKAGDKICLKGTRINEGPSKIFAYEISRQP